MYEDDPQDTVFDVLGDAVFGDHPLGRPIIGRAPVIRDTPVGRDRRVPRAPLRAGSVVVAAAGSVDHDAIVELAERTLGGLRGGRERAGARRRRRRCRRRACASSVKETEQVHVCLGGPGMARGDERRFAVRVLDAIFGGLSSSRLFQSVREERGLAYAVYSFAGNFTDTGQIGLYVGTRPDNLAEAMQVVRRRARRGCASSPRPRTSSRAHGRTSRRASCSRMESSLGAHEPPRAAPRSTACRCSRADEIMARFDAVTMDDLRVLVRRAVGARAALRRRHRARRGRVQRRRGAGLPGRGGSGGMITRRRRGRRRPHGPGGVRRGRRRGRSRARGPRRPGAGSASWRTVLDGCDVVVDFTRPDTALDNARLALAAGRHVVIGTTGFDVEALREAASSRERERLRRAELRDRRRADDAVRRRGVAAHAARRDHRVPPPGQARRAVGHRERGRRT